MAYQNVGTPRFYVNVYEWANSIGMNVMEDGSTFNPVLNTLPVIPKDFGPYMGGSPGTGNLIDLNKNINTTDLPTVFGESAEMYFLNFYDDLKKNDFLTDKIQNFYYFQIGRWDIQLLNGQLIKFPSINIVESIRQIVKLLNRKDMKKYNVIDLRIKNKVVVE